MSEIYESTVERHNYNVQLVTLAVQTILYVTDEGRRRGGVDLMDNR